jgi:hypothetical protein
MSRQTSVATSGDLRSTHSYGGYVIRRNFLQQFAAISLFWRLLEIFSPTPQ